jgi:hypothetical protein
MRDRAPGRVGILWRGDRAAAQPREHGRFAGVFETLEKRGLSPEAVLYDDAAFDDVRAQILQLDAVLVWVDPISDGHDRSCLDPLLRDVSSRGVWVSTHPDVILKMGTKDVLVKTRDMEWGTECFLYRTEEEMSDQLPLRLLAGPRVLKQHRGNGGNGVWKIELASQILDVNQQTPVRVLHAQRGSSLEQMSLGEFIARCKTYFQGTGCMIDQPFQQRLAEGMIRCYLVRDRVAGFGHQYVTALLPPPEGTLESPAPPPRLYYGPDKPEFQALKSKLEGGWVAEMQRILGIDSESLPALWDADFLHGSKDALGRDTYVLCETNVSSVFPFPDEALDPLADAVARKLTGNPSAT